MPGYFRLTKCAGGGIIENLAAHRTCAARRIKKAMAFSAIA